jgi:outer membrane protein, heavy metal efflux system
VWSRRDLRPLFAALALLVARADARGETVTIEECGRQALARSAAIRAAGFEAAAAAAHVREARAAYAPRFEMHSEYGLAEGFDEAVTNGGSTAAIVRLEATLLDGGVRNAAVAGAEAQARAASAVERQRRADLLLAVRSAYFQALAAARAREVHEAAVTRLDDYLRVLGRQAKLGIAGENDVMRAELAIHTERTALRAAERDLTEARAALASLADVGTAAVLIEPVSKAARDASGVEASPLLAEARAQLAVAERGAEALRAERAGQVTASAEAGALGVHPSQTFEHDAGGQFLVGYTLPLFDGGVRASKLAAARAAIEGARAKVDEVARTLRLSWAQADAEARRAEADAAAAREAAATAEENFQLMRARHAGGGNVRLLEVLDALTQATEARLGESKAMFDYRMAVATQAELLGEVDP